MSKVDNYNAIKDLHYGFHKPNRPKTMTYEHTLPLKALVRWAEREFEPKIEEPRLWSALGVEYFRGRCREELFRFVEGLEYGSLPTNGRPRKVLVFPPIEKWLPAVRLLVSDPTGDNLMFPHFATSDHKRVVKSLGHYASPNNPGYLRRVHHEVLMEKLSLDQELSGLLTYILDKATSWLTNGESLLGPRMVWELPPSEVLHPRLQTYWRRLNGVPEPRNWPEPTVDQVHPDLR